MVFVLVEFIDITTTRLARHIQPCKEVAATFQCFNLYLLCVFTSGHHKRGSLFSGRMSVTGFIRCSNRFSTKVLYCSVPKDSTTFTVLATDSFMISLKLSTRRSRLSSRKEFPIFSITSVRDLVCFKKFFFFCSAGSVHSDGFHLVGSLHSQTLQ